MRTGKPSYVTLTTAANDSMREVHSRMPLLFTKEQVSTWLIEPELAKQILHSIPPMLEKVPAVAQVSFW